MKNPVADRVRELPPYLFAHIDKLKAEARQKGIDLIDFGIGDPDLPTPPHIIEALASAAAKPEYHRYPSYEGMLRTREAAARFYARRFAVKLDPAREVLTLIGSKEGIAHFPLATIDPGDLALVPDPAYPVYATATQFAGGQVYRYGLLPRQQFLPDLASIPEDVARRAKVLYVNYPNNPTGGVATLEDYQRIHDFACRYDLIVVSDLAYSEMYFEDPAPASYLQVPGAMERGIEFHSLSKTYNMTGWRVAFAVGNATLVGALGKIKTNVDSGVFGAVQEAAIAALDGDQSAVDEMRGIYRERRNLLAEGLRAMGLEVHPPRGTFYFFVGLPPGLKAMDLTSRMLTEAGVVATPGTGFGQRGEGFIRFALCQPAARIREACERLATITL
ncbi:MAG: LL-diaminopimelate aminotransferase [Deltaproteobacteria bacterium]|nr:LL-diaminopimelate aminotransferase [Deltaproteobacteria bacterium]